MSSHRVRIAADHPAFAGHFPGRPLLPGVSIVAEVLEAAKAVLELAARIGDAPRLSVIKFLSPVLPGAELEIAFRATASGLDFTVTNDGRVAASGSFASATAQAADA